MNTDTEKSVPRKKGAAKKKGTARKKGVAKKKGADTDVNKRYFWIIITLIYLVLFALEVIVLSKYEVLVLDTKVNLGLSVFLAQVLYTFASLRIIGPKELGARIFFGKPIDEVSSGLAFIPFGFFRLSEETRLVIQDELHANPDEVSLPIKIPFGFPEEGSDDPLDVRIIAEVAIIVRWRISKFITFLTTIGSRKEARRQMQDSAVAMLTSEFAKITPAVALKNLTSYNNDLKKEIGKRVRLWGVYMENAQIKAINFPDELRNAIQLVPMATAEARATIIGAEAEKEKLRLLGEGSGQAEKAILEGRTAGFKDMAEELDIRSSSILGAETARAITENPGQKTIIPGSSGFSNLVSIAAVMGEVFSETKDTEDSSEEKS